VVLIAIVVVAMAGHRKETELPGEKVGLSEFNLTKGLLIAVFCGVMSSFFAFGLDFGTPIKEASLKAGTGQLWGGLPVICVVLVGGFATNLVWSGYLILKNGSASEWIGKHRAAANAGAKEETIPLVPNYLFSALAGATWYMQFFFYTMGETQMGHYKFSSWTLHMASIIIFSTLWGIALKEWRGVSRRTKILVFLTLLTLVGSTVIVGYGNYLAIHP